MVNQVNILLWQTLVWCYLPDRRWQQCRNQNRLALLLIIMTSDITWYRTWHSVSGCSVNLTCISDNVIYHYFNIFPPGGRKSGGTIDRVTADSPYNGAHCTGT